MGTFGCCRVQPTNRVRYFPTPALRLFEGSDALLDRESDKTRKVANVEFPHQSRAVGLHRFRRKRQRLRDLGDGVSLGEQLKDLSLAGAETLEGFLRGGFVGDMVDQAFSQLSAEMMPAFVRLSNRIDHFPGDRFLRDVA